MGRNDFDGEAIKKIDRAGRVMWIPFVGGWCETSILGPAYIVEVGSANLGEGDGAS